MAYTAISLWQDDDGRLSTHPVNLSPYVNTLLGEGRAFLSPKAIDVRVHRTAEHPMSHQLLVSLIPDAFIPDPWRISHVFDGGFTEVGKAATYQDALLELHLQSDLLEERLRLFDVWTSQLMNRGSAGDTPEEITLGEQLAATLLFAAASRTRIM